jgi:membrane fusion protein (multidrug efflux system)
MDTSSDQKSGEAPAAPPINFPPLYKRPHFWAVMGALFCAAFALLGWGLYNRHYYVSTNDAYIEVRKVTISPDSGGRIHRLHVDEGAAVTKGMLIAEIDPSIELAEKNKALREELKAQKARAQAEQKRKKLSEDFFRINSAFEAGIATQRERDDLMREFEIARIGERIAEIEIEIVQANIALIDQRLSHLKIYAPCDGVIAKRWLWEGDTASFGQPIFILNDLSDLWVTANLEEKKLTHVRLGDNVDIHVDAFPDIAFTGKVFTIKAMAASQISLLPPDNATGNFTKVEQRVPIKMTLEPKDKQNLPEKLMLFPGMSVEVKLKIR